MSGWKTFLWFAGGVAVGAVGAAVFSKGNCNFKPLVKEWVSRGMDIKDAMVAKMETAKEDMQDFMAEARYESEVRRQSASAQPAAPKPGDKPQG